MAESQKLPDKLEMFKAGATSPSVFSADYMNKIVSLLNALRNLEIEDYRPEWADANVKFVRSDTTRDMVGGLTGEVEQFRVVAVHQEHLVCNRVTLDATGRIATLDPAAVRIAKPFELRNRVWDEDSRSNAGLPREIDGCLYNLHNEEERTVTLVDGSGYLTGPIDFGETVDPPYVAGHSIIYAAKVKQRPLFTVTETVNNVPTAYPLEWIDLNSAARRFEMNLRKIKVCTGVAGNWYALIPASEAFQEE